MSVMRRLTLCALMVGSLSAAAICQSPETPWTFTSPREEISPNSAALMIEGRATKQLLTIKADDREGLDGYWKKTYPIEGGKTYQFQAYYKAKGVKIPRLNVVAEIYWTNAEGKKISLDEPSVGGYLKGATAMAEPEFPATKGENSEGWTEVSDVYTAPKTATQATVQLHLRWARNAEVTWTQITLAETSPPTPRIARLATVHFIPRGGKTPADNCKMYEPFIAEAAEKKADLVVLGETLTFVGLGKTYADCAEPIPGPSTDYFGELAKKHNLYIVAGLIERDKNLIYNVAVLLGPDGRIVGKYRKVCLPRGEVEGGVAPGSEYPVFNTRFGKLGMMVCYDGFFPEVARELSNAGAEVIAWPVWGCNPLLAQARACENHVYVVSSTYEDVSRNWMISAVYNHIGDPIAHAKTWGSTAIAEVDLNARTRWISLGDFKAELPRHRPLGVNEKK